MLFIYSSVTLQKCQVKTKLLVVNLFNLAHGGLNVFIFEVLCISILSFTNC